MALCAKLAGAREWLFSCLEQHQNYFKTNDLFFRCCV